MASNLDNPDIINVINDATGGNEAPSSVTRSDLQRITDKVRKDFGLDADDYQEFELLVGALLNPFDPAAENIQLPGAPDGTILYHNQTSESITVPENVDRIVVAMDGTGSARNGEISATAYLLNSTLVSSASPQSLDDGCIVDSIKLAFNLNAQQFDCYDAYSMAVSIKDETSIEYRNGTSAAASLTDRTTHPAQMYPGKIGSLTSRKENYLESIPKDDAVIAVSRNVGAVRDSPYRQGFNTWNATYANSIQGAESTTGVNGGWGRGSQMTGASNYINYPSWAPDCQMIQGMEERKQSFYVGAAPSLHVIPNLGGTAAQQGGYKIWSTKDMPALYATSGSNVDPYLPRDCNAIRLNGKIKLTAALDSAPTALQAGSTTTNCAQGWYMNSFSCGAPDDAAPVYPNLSGAPSTAYVNTVGEEVLGDISGAYTTDIGVTKGLLKYAPAYASQTAGGWLIEVKLLGATSSDGAGSTPVDRVIGVGRAYAVLGTMAQVSYEGSPGGIEQTSSWWSPIAKLGAHYPAGTNTGSVVPVQGCDPYGKLACIQSTTSIGEFDLSGITVRPGMGGTEYDKYSTGETVTGVEVVMTPYTAAPWQNGVVRALTCSEGHFGTVDTVNTTAGTTYTAANTVATVSAPDSPLGGRICRIDTGINYAGAAVGTMNLIRITDPGWGYTTPPTVTFTGGAPSGAQTAFVSATLLDAATAAQTVVIGTPTIDGQVQDANAIKNGNQFAISMTGISGDFIRYDADISAAERQVVIMSGLIGKGTIGASNVSIQFSAYSSARLKAYKSPIALVTSRDQSKKSNLIQSALAEISKFAPNLFTSPRAHAVSQAAFYSQGGPRAALHAASGGWASRLWKATKSMIAPSRVKKATQAFDTLTSDVKKDIAGLADRKMAEYQNRAENMARDKLRGIGLMAGTDAAPTGAGFWGDFSKGFNSVIDTASKVAQVAAPLMAGTDGRPTGAGCYAATDDSVGNFAVIHQDGSFAGTRKLTFSKGRKDADYNEHTSVFGNLYLDKRLKDEDTKIPSLVHTYMSKHPTVNRLFLTVSGSGPIYGKSWEAAAASALNGDDQPITGKIDHWYNTPNGLVVDLGAVTGVGSKSEGLQAQGKVLRAPVENAGEGNTENVETINVN